MIKSLCMTLLYCPGLTCIEEGWQYHGLVDFQLGVRLYFNSLPDKGSSECHIGVCNSGSDLIINVHCSGESDSQVGEISDNFQFLSIHIDDIPGVRHSRCRMCSISVSFVLIVRS